MSLSWQKIFVVFLAMVLGHLAQAAERKPTLGVLPFETVGLSEEWGLEHLSVLSEELSLLDRVRLIPFEKTWPQLGASMLKLKAGCLEDVACASRTGRSLKADYLLHLLAEKSVEGITLTMKLVDVHTGRQVGKASDYASTESTDQARAIRWLVRTVCSPLIAPGNETGKLRLSGELEGAEIFINGKRMQASAEGLTVPAGALDLVVRKKDHLPYHDVVVLMPGAEIGLEIALKPLKVEVPSPTVSQPGGQNPLSGSEQPPPPPPPPPIYRKWWFWAAVGVVVVGAGGLTAYLMLSSGATGRGDVAATWK